MSHRRSTVKGSLSFANPTVRAWLFQILAVVAVVGIVGWLFHNTVTNLNNRGITSGFAFLDRGAGFGIVQHLIDYQQGDTYGRVFIVGLLNTLLVSALCIVFASVLGFFIGLARLSDNWLLRKLSTIYIEIFRNIPPLLQIFFWYFAVLRNLPGPRQAVSAFDLAFLSNRGLYIPSPQLGDGFIAFILAVVMAIVLSVGLFRFNKTYQIKTGQLRRTWPIAAVLIIGLPLLAQWLFGAALHWDVPALRGFNFRGGMVLIPELAALTLALSVYTSAFIAEIIRAGIQAVPYGQHEAARSLGLPNPVTLRQVIIPQALRVIIPPLTSQYLNIVKNSSLAAAIGYPDMVSLFAGTVLNQTGQAIETIAMTMSVYLIISLTISLLMNIYKEVMPENYQIGSIPTNIQFTGSIEPEEDLDGYSCPFTMINYKNPNENISQWLFKDSFFEMPPFHPEFYDQKIDRTKYPINDKVARIVPHKYPKLVGTLDKCKFVLIKEAVDAGVADDPTVKIFERDFLGKHLQMGILNPNHIELLVELKMDGMSVEADVTNQILSARSRGDTAQDLADDLSVVFDGYQFPNCPPIDDSFGMKFECIITKTNLQKLAELRGRPYKNARNGVIGLIKSQDAYAFRDLVTLVPLETSLDIDPVTEVKFMNQ